MKIYNKLVRDKIPEIIKANGQECVTVILKNDNDYFQSLKMKLKEEVDEFMEYEDTMELTDILEVVYAIAGQQGVSIEELEKRRLEKKEKNGGFEKRVFLDRVK